MHGLNEDMNVSGVTVKDASNRSSWKKAICCGDPYNRDKPKEKEVQDEYNDTVFPSFIAMDVLDSNQY